MTTSPNYRPYDLPADLPNPPAPPKGTRWEYSGYDFYSTEDKSRAWIIPSVGWNACEDATASYNPTHYLEAVPLRPVPAGLPALEDGWEFFGDGPLSVTHNKFRNDIAACSGSIEWKYDEWNGDGSCIYALRIGSEVHHRNIVAHAEPAPAKDSSDGHEADFVTTEPDWKDVAEQAAEHIRSLFRAAEREHFPEAVDFLETYFPEPASPEFDWSALWDELPSWIGWVAMDHNGDWLAYSDEPSRNGKYWDGPKGFTIPAEFAPPAASDWTQSLSPRPQPTKAE